MNAVCLWLRCCVSCSCSEEGVETFTIGPLAKGFKYKLKHGTPLVGTYNIDEIKADDLDILIVPGLCMCMCCACTCECICLCFCSVCVRIYFAWAFVCTTVQRCTVGACKCLALFPFCFVRRAPPVQCCCIRPLLHRHFLRTHPGKNADLCSACACAWRLHDSACSYALRTCSVQKRCE